MELQHKRLTWPSSLDPFDVRSLVFSLAFESAYRVLHSSTMLMTVTASILVSVESEIETFGRSIVGTVRS
jgi:hypothetical protein